MPCKVINQTEDLGAFARAGVLGLLAAGRAVPTWRSGYPTAENSLHRHTTGGLASVVPAVVSVATSGCATRGLLFIQMIRDEGRFVKAQAEVFQQLGNREDVGEDAKTFVEIHCWIMGDRRPGAAAPGLDGALLQCVWPAWLAGTGSASAGTAWRLFVRHAVQPITTRKLQTQAPTVFSCTRKTLATCATLCPSIAARMARK